MAVLLWGNANLGQGTCSQGPFRSLCSFMQKLTHTYIHSQVCSVLGALDRGYREESKGWKWPVLALSLGLPDSEHSSCLLFSLPPKGSPEEP